MKEYTTRSGRGQCMPSIEEATAMDAEQQGFCLNCGHVQDGVEPDARRYTCEDCEKDKVYGAAELFSWAWCTDHETHRA